MQTAKAPASTEVLTFADDQLIKHIYLANSYVSSGGVLNYSHGYITIREPKTGSTCIIPNFVAKDAASCSALPYDIQSLLRVN